MGRPNLWSSHDYHTLDEDRGALYDFTDLLAVKLKSDDAFKKFINTWESCQAAMKDPPAPNIMDILFCEQLKRYTWSASGKRGTANPWKQGNQRSAHARSSSALETP